MASEYEVSISCRNLANKDLLSKSDPVAILLENVPHTKRFVEIGRTELIKDCLNPNFATKFRLADRHGEEDATLRVAVIDIDDFDDLERLAEQDFIGRAEFHRSLLFANPTFTVSLTNKSGEVTFKTVRYDAARDGRVTLELASSGFRLKEKSAFLEIHRADEGGGGDSGEFTLVYRSEHSATGAFEPVRLSLFTLALGERDRQLRLEVWRYSSKGEHTKLGQRGVTLAELERLYVTENSPVLEFEACTPGKGGADRGCLELKVFDLRA